MDKEELKSKIRQAIEKGPLKDSIERLSLFGSYASGRPSKQSDVDLLIEFSPHTIVGFFALAELKDYIEKKIEKKVDLLTPDAISQHIKKNILNQADLIYEK